jgi:acyl dehydratase
MTPEAITAAADRIIAAGDCAPRLGRDPVNQPMINNWVEALGDANPIYVDEEAARAAGFSGTVAPPAMAQVWTMFGLNGSRPDDDPMAQVTELPDCQQTYHRYLAVGEQVAVTSRLSDIRGPKRTALGEGWFVTFQTSWQVGDEVVAEMLFRLLKFAPGTGAVPKAPAG